MFKSIKTIYNGRDVNISPGQWSRTSQARFYDALRNHIWGYPTPSNLNYSFGFGFIAGIMLVVQIVTGLFLSMYYTPHVDYAFDSVEYIMRSVNNGWLLRYTHANGASFFFIAVYAHIGRGLYYRSYTAPREKVWYTGVVIFILLMATAFLGYVLPWGQMGYWGATVITNLFTVIPFFGTDIAYWLWGGFTVSNATLNRFFVLHFLLPIVLAGFVILHLLFLHKAGSNNPLGVVLYDDVKFFPYYVIKDLFGFFLFILLFVVIVFFYPNLLGHPDNYIKANPLCTPPHIVPEWYFLPFYTILRAVPNKVGGVFLMGSSIAVMFLLPALDKQSPLKSPAFRTEFRFFFWVFIGTVVFLMILGTLPADEPFTTLSQKLTFYYFFYFLGILPALGWFERAAASEVTLSAIKKMIPFLFVSFLTIFLVTTLKSSTALNAVETYAIVSDIHYPGPHSGHIVPTIVKTHEFVESDANTVITVDLLRETVTRVTVDSQLGKVSHYELHVPTGVEKLVEHKVLEQPEVVAGVK